MQDLCSHTSSISSTKFVHQLLTNLRPCMFSYYMCVTSCNTKEIKYKVLHIFHILRLFVVHRYICINPIQCIFTTHKILPYITICDMWIWTDIFHAILPTFTSYIYLVCIDMRDPCVMLQMVLGEKKSVRWFNLQNPYWQWFCRSDFLASQTQVLVTE